MEVKIKKIISFFVISIIIISNCLPIVSKAEEDTSNEVTLSVQLERDETDSNLIHVIATDSQYNITDLKYVPQYIETDNVSYFEEDHDDIYEFDITPSQSIEVTFELSGYGSYTVYAKNSRGDIFLARLTVNDPNNVPQITLEKDEENPLILNIEVTSNNYTIEKLKIAKKDNINDNIDFSTEGTDIEFVKSNQVSVKYTGIEEEGLYVVYAEDSAGNKATSQMYVAERNTPISVEITEGTNTREVNLQITDSICDIVSVKVAKTSEITSFDDFDDIEGLEITQGQTVNVTYIAPEDDTYIFYIEDEAGYRLMTQKRITAEEKTMNVTITQDEDSPGNLTITATNNICDIVKMKVAIGEDITIDYFQDNGEEIEIESGREVVGTYTVSEDCRIYVYVEDEQGYSYMYTINLTGITSTEEQPSEEDTTPPEITGVEENGIYNYNVTPIITDENLAEIYLTKDEVDVQNYTNGDTLEEEGEYILKAVDEAGNETVVSFIIDKTAPEITITQQNTDNENVEVYISLSDNLTGIQTVKAAQGEQTIDYFEDGGQELTFQKDGTSAIAAINVIENGTYTIYTKDEAGNTAIEVFEVTSIEDEPEFNDTTPPSIEITNDAMDGRLSETITFTITDSESQIATVKIANGEQNIEYFEDNGTILQMVTGDKTAEVKVRFSENGTYTLYAEDEYGNATIYVINITGIDRDSEDSEHNPDDEDTNTSTGNTTDDDDTNTSTGNTTDDDDTNTSTGNTTDDDDTNTSTGNTTDDDDTNTSTGNTTDDDDTNTSTGNTTDDDDTNTSTGNTTDDDDTNTNTGNTTDDDDTNTNTGNATDDDDTNINTGNAVGGSNSSNIGSSSGSSNSNGSSTSSSKLPYAGLENVLLIAIVITASVAIFTYIKYKKYE